MIRLEYNSQKIQITNQKKKLFGGIKEVVTEVCYEDIDKVTKEMFNDTLHSMTIISKNGDEEFIIAEKLENGSVLNDLFDYLLERRNEYSYRLSLLDIDSLEETDV